MATDQQKEISWYKGFTGYQTLIRLSRATVQLDTSLIPSCHDTSARIG